MNVEINANLPVVVPDAVCFETGATRAQAADPELWVYEHHGEGFGWADPGALTCFFDDLIHGRPMPLKFSSKNLRDIDVLVAAALHQMPGLVIYPNALKIVTAADLVHRRGAVGMAHIDSDLTHFFRFIRGLFPKVLLKREFDERLAQVIGYTHDYIANDRHPQMGSEPPPPTVLDKGTHGFVVAETKGPLGEAWVHLFRSGYLRGLVVGAEVAGRRLVLGARKGPFVPLQVEKAAHLLNEIERAIGELPEWTHDALWLYGPPEGTSMLVTHMLEVLIRV